MIVADFRMIYHPSLQIFLIERNIKKHEPAIHYIFDIIY